MCLQAFVLFDPACEPFSASVPLDKVHGDDNKPNVDEDHNYSKPCVYLTCENEDRYRNVNSKDAIDPISQRELVVS
jgi:hypothetical protein